MLIVSTVTYVTSNWHLNISLFFLAMIAPMVSLMKREEKLQMLSSVNLQLTPDFW